MSECQHIKYVTETQINMIARANGKVGSMDKSKAKGLMPNAF